jgi:porphobilinogen deaminase
VGKSCWQLSHRYSQCNVAVEHLLMSNFRENCSIPMSQFERERPRRIHVQEIIVKNKKEMILNTTIAIPAKAAMYLNVMVCKEICGIF